MDKMPSTQFRKAYATLTEPTDVTVNGHTIGAWYPAVYLEKDKVYFPTGDGRIYREDGTKVGTVPVVEGRFNSKPFTPAPKKGK